MVRQQVTINNKKGLHARPATQFLKECLKFESCISIGYNDQFVNAKSMTGLLRLGIPGGSDVELVVEGVDESLASTSLVQFLNESLLD